MEVPPPPSSSPPPPPPAPPASTEVDRQEFRQSEDLSISSRVEVPPPPSSPPPPPPPPAAAVPPVSSEVDRLGFRQSENSSVSSPAPNPFSQIIQKPVVVNDSAINGFDAPPESSNGNDDFASDNLDMNPGPEIAQMESLVTLDSIDGLSSFVDFDNAASGKTVKKGILWKRSRARKFFSRVMGIKNWKKRMFVLTSSRELWYYVPGEESSTILAKGKILLNECSVKRVDDAFAFGRSNAFEITAADGEKILLSSEDVNDSQTWIDIIEKAGS